MSDITMFVFQLAVIIFTVRIFAKLAKKIGIPTVLGELVAGMLIGPYALGAIKLPFLPDGLFPVGTDYINSVSPELYAVSQIAAIILLFASGIETDLTLFLKYSVSGGVIGLGGVVVSFLFGDICAMFLLDKPFTDLTCLFFGVMSTATSVGITARILSDKKKMDSPEGVTIIAAAVFDDVLGIVVLAVIMGIATAATGGAALDGGAIGFIALKAFGIWLIFTVVCIVFAKPLARFIRFFGGTYDFSIAALGLAFLLAGFFESQGLAMIIGAYTTGLALSRTDVAPVIQERIHGLYKFFVPVFFAVMGMNVNFGEIFNTQTLMLGLIYTAACILAKILGCGLPALALGFNFKGGLRIGTGMIPRGEVALIVAGIGLANGIIEQYEFGVVILMTLVTTIVAPPLLSASLKIKGKGVKKDIDVSETQVFEWNFRNADMVLLMIDLFVRELRKEKFYAQIMNLNEGFSQVRKGDISILLEANGPTLLIKTSAKNMRFAKEKLYVAVKDMEHSVESLNALKEEDLRNSVFDNNEAVAAAK